MKPNFEPIKYTRKKCFICCKKIHKSRFLKLSSISSESVEYAFKYHNITIDKRSKCCKKHLDSKKNLLIEEYKKLIPSYNKLSYIKFLQTRDLTLDSKEDRPTDKNNTENCCVFENFKNPNGLAEKLCKTVTGWSKEVFLRFSKYIVSGYNNWRRSKYELIAMYRYWLIYGHTQLCLALLKSDATQQDISRWLDQIRRIIANDFTPLFLGINQKREFFIGHNSISSKVLHNLKDDELAVVLDATYITIEQSKNNKFQYETWSSYKGKHLIKPFIACCSDGWIINVYSNFLAIDNEAKIIKNVIRNHSDIRELFTRNKTYLFVDRGKNFFNKIILTCFKIKCFRISRCSKAFGRKL